MSADIVILPCPFCGGDSRIENGPPELWYGECIDCGINGKIKHSSQEASAAWNRRAAIPQAKKTMTKPSTLAEQVAWAQEEMVTWPPEVRASVRLEGGDAVKAPDQNAHDIGMAHIICDSAGIPPGEIIGRLVRLSGKGDAAKVAQEPNQPLIIDKHGVRRFRANVLVAYLLDNGPFNMNDLAVVECSTEDREQFAQLIGYSLGGYGDLSYVTDARFYAAQGPDDADESEVTPQTAPSQAKEKSK